ncbi:hypothetical protein T4D_1176 [Trichinella pseudospiralis]|uniref:Uncharacterized protein n=1 Tax=Trichinella pseudospiralis TaxID=6337 RepID=A0A0V1DQY1_TRIPS|nr:hypothetical protein T4D_1176 [Trichinella pseudospiralis]
MRLFPPFLIKYISRNPEKTGELALKIRKFRGNVIFSKVAKMGINRFGIKFRNQ